MRFFMTLLFATLAAGIPRAADFTPQPLSSAITGVQPFTGIVFWSESDKNTSDAIQLEFSYMLYSNVVKEQGVYNWNPVDSLLDKIASRKHQAILRFRDTYPGYTTAVPDYIKKLPDYTETEGQSENLKTYFPDWRSNELKRFILEFFTNFAQRYDHDKRLAYLQVGFGLWAEYHIYDGPSELGKTFPDKTFQNSFFRHLDTTFTTTPWSVSIDAADATMSSLTSDKSLVAIDYGLFDNSFLNKDHGGYNTECWNFFGKNRFLSSPAGGEFSYYTDADQRNALAANGPHGTSFETAAKSFHISYIIGNDQPEYQTLARIKTASRACGYAFRIVGCATTADSATIQVRNVGIAPLYYDAFVAVNGVRSPTSLKFLAPDSLRTCKAGAGGSAPRVTIECDRLVAGQKIEFLADLKGDTHMWLPAQKNERCSREENSMRLFTIDGRSIRGNPAMLPQQSTLHSRNSANGIRIGVTTEVLSRPILLR